MAPRGSSSRVGSVNRWLSTPSDRNLALVCAFFRVDADPVRIVAPSRGGGRARNRVLLLATAIGFVAAACGAQPGASPAPNPDVGGPAVAQAEATDGPVKLAFDLRATSWSASEPIEGTASLSVTAAIEVGGSGEGLLGFQYNEIGGLGRHMEWVTTADCRPYQLEPGQPVSSSLTKAGGYSPGASGADFYASFLADPAVHLPAGDWTITALAAFIDFSNDQGCHLPSHDLSAPITIHVTP